MKILIVVLSVLTLGKAQVEVRLPFGNPAGVTFTGAGFANNFQFQQQLEGAPAPQPQPLPLEPAQPLAAAEPQPIPQEQPQPAELQQPQYAYAAAPAQIPQPAPVQPQYAYAAAPAPIPQPAPVQPQYAYAAAPAPIPQPAPVQPQFAYAQQPQVLAAAPAPLQYHRAVEYGPAPVAAVAPVAPIVQKHHQIGYAATPVLTKVPGVADVPVTKLAYSQGFTQQEVDVHQPAVSTRKVKVRRPALRKEFYDIEHRVIVRPAGSATLELSQPIAKEQQGPAVLTATKFAHIAPVVRYGASRRIVDGDAALNGPFGVRNAPAPLPEALPQGPAPPQAAAPRSAAPAPPQPQQRPQLRQALDADTEVVEAAQQQGRDDLPSPPEPQPIPQQPAPGQEQPQQQPQLPQGPQENGRGLTITPDMPIALQNRLLELLTAKGGTVTEVLNKDGSPADSASVLQVADALGDPQLQGGERITTRRIVVTRPIETVQEIEVQEPATKIHRKIVQQPALFKHHVPAVARVPVAVPAVKHVATPVVKTSYTAAHPAAYSFNYQAPNFAYSH